jgi:hypothetical protein
MQRHVLEVQKNVQGDLGTGIEDAIYWIHTVLARPIVTFS